MDEPDIDELLICYQSLAKQVSSRDREDTVLRAHNFMEELNDICDKYNVDINQDGELEIDGYTFYREY
jgi:hypothetical protein